MLDWVCSVTGARAARALPRVQSLWGGYGEILRVALDGGPVASVIVKAVRPPSSAAMDAAARRSHERKLRSYAVEAAFYRAHAREAGARVPRSWAVDEGEGTLCLLLEDLDEAGFSGRRRHLDASELDACLRWLAGFHASFMARAPEDLWPVGTYWHLQTRPDELDAMSDRVLAAAAPAIDRALSDARYHTLVHGDAKPANFCFGAQGVAAVDFQYVGGGCGMKDVVYLVSCIEEERAQPAIERYFDHLRDALAGHPEARAIEDEWRRLTPLAWADLERFLSGWSPGHRPGPLGAAMCRSALAALDVPRP